MRNQILANERSSASPALAARVSEPAVDGVLHVVLDADGPRGMAVPALAPGMTDGEPVLGSRQWVVRDDRGQLVAVGPGARGPRGETGETGERGPAGAYIGQLIWSGLPLSDEPGLLPCDGRGITSAMGFPLLRARLIAATYPYGTASGDPRIPDLRDRVIAGAGSVHTAGVPFGSETASIAIPHLPAHTHNPSGATNVAHDGFAGSPASLSAGGAALRMGPLQSQGSNQPHANTQPSLATFVYIVAALP